MQISRSFLSPDTLALLDAVARQGSFAAAARAMGLVPSAVTYRVRQIEDALDVLLFDRSSRHAKLTPAGAELLREATRLLQEIDSVAQRVQRVATGWEPQFTIAVDTVISRPVLMELVEAFFTLNPPTRVRILNESLAGTLDALTSGRADLALGVTLDFGTAADVQTRNLGAVDFVYAVAPHHPLAPLQEPLSDIQIQQHRAVAVADSTQAGQALTVNLLGGQDVFTVPTMQAKLEALLRGLGAGFLPAPMAQPYLATGRLVQKSVERTPRVARMAYAWRGAVATRHGRALQWWLQQLEHKGTQEALLHRHKGTPVARVE